MPIVLPESLERPPVDVPETELKPQEIVAELDKYIIGQKAAKKAVAIALRNRYRRRRLPPDLADEIGEVEDGAQMRVGGRVPLFGQVRRQQVGLRQQTREQAVMSLAVEQ